jgi:protein-disulfide isomerase
VVFSDFQCAYCKDEAKMLRDNLVKAFPTQVRLYFKDYPLAQIHPWAMTAAVAGRCLYEQGNDDFWAFHDWIFENQTSITPETVKDKIAGFATSKSWDADKVNACLASPQALAGVQRSMAEGRALGVASTPTMFINGRKIPYSIKWENLKQIVDFEIGYQQTAHNAGEACCSVQVPTPLNSSQPK